jgi:hypothetical protein
MRLQHQLVSREGNPSARASRANSIKNFVQVLDGRPSLGGAATLFAISVCLRSKSV